MFIFFVELIKKVDGIISIVNGLFIFIQDQEVFC